MDIHLSPFTDGVSTRRGSLMAGLQHGGATIGTSGIHTDDIMRRKNGQALLLSSVKDQNEFNAAVLSLAHDVALRENLGHEAYRLYHEKFAWEVIAKYMVGALQKQK